MSPLLMYSFLRQRYDTVFFHSPNSSLSQKLDKIFSMRLKSLRSRVPSLHCDIMVPAAVAPSFCLTTQFLVTMFSITSQQLLRLKPSSVLLLLMIQSRNSYDYRHLQQFFTSLWSSRKKANSYNIWMPTWMFWKASQDWSTPCMGGWFSFWSARLQQAMMAVLSSWVRREVQYMQWEYSQTLPNSQRMTLGNTVRLVVRKMRKINFLKSSSQQVHKLSTKTNPSEKRRRQTTTISTALVCLGQKNSLLKQLTSTPWGQMRTTSMVMMTTQRVEKKMMQASLLKKLMMGFLMFSTYMRLKQGKKQMETLRVLMANKTKGSSRQILQNIARIYIYVWLVRQFSLQSSASSRILPVRQMRLARTKARMAVMVAMGLYCLMGNQSWLSRMLMTAQAARESWARRQRASGKQESAMRYIFIILIIYLQMDKPINQILNIKSLDQLKTYLEERPQLNLAIMMDKSNTTLLHFASLKNDILRLRLFIRHYKEFTQLHHGSGMYTGESSFVSKLRAWVNSPNKEGYLPIHYAALHGNLEMIEFLAECGTNMHYRTTKDENVLFMCVDHDRIQPLVYFLESANNYNINETNYRRETILHLAAHKGYADIVSYLVTVGADIDARNIEGQTPLILATMESKRQVVKRLLIKGADRSQADDNGRTALTIAQQNGKQDLIRVLDNNYGCWDSFLIKCNKKITYEPEQPSYSYSILFILVFHLFFLPINILSEFNIDPKFIKVIPLVFEGIYELLIFVLYFLLLKKFRKRKPMPLVDIQPPFCPECRRKLGSKMFHCHICDRCIYRYDHHCPWINNCVGSHNIGKFTMFLIVLALGMVEVIFCNVCLFLKKDWLVRYRSNFHIPNWAHITINAITVVMGSLILFALVSLIAGQLQNIFSNSTSFERKKRSMPRIKRDLLSSQNSMTEVDDEEEEEQVQGSCACFSNCMAMLSEPS